MKIFEKNKSFGFFSDLHDGDLSLYLWNEEKNAQVWNELKAAQDFNLGYPTFAFQSHEDQRIIVEQNTKLWESGKADALITGEKNRVIGVFTADCLPVLLFGEKSVAAIHAGWRSARLNICSKTVTDMVETFGEKTKKINAVIGPCIGECCLEMGPEILPMFIEADDRYSTFFKKKEKWHLNLRELNSFQLKEAGLKPENIENYEKCTFCEEKNFFSFRRQKQRNGSMFSFIMRT